MKRFAHIDDMSKPLFYAFILSVILLSIVFFPFLIEGSFHYDMNRKKYAFAVKIFRIKLIGGYFTVYPGGFAMHVSDKKVFLFPFQRMNDDRKRFAFIKTFRLIRFHLTTETGAEYLLQSMAIQAFIRLYLQQKAQYALRIKTGVWLTEGDVLRISGNWLIFFNLFILIKNFIIFLKEKLTIIWRKKTEKSKI